MQKLPCAKCDSCPLVNEPMVPPSGPIEARLVVVGEAPGAEEVSRGAPFVGPSGTVLDYALSEAGIQHNEVYMTNTVMCRPPLNRTPSYEEVEACAPRLKAELDRTRGTLVALGLTASEALQLTHLDRGQLTENTSWAGKVMHTYHPAYILRKPSDSPVFIQDIEKAVRGIMPANPKWSNPDIIHIEDIDTLKKYLDAVPDNTWVAFDIETDQVKWYVSYDGTPADPILMLQMAWEDTWGIVLDDMMLYDVPETRVILRDFFKRVRTVGHNGKFDVIFLTSHIGVRPRLDFDTMLAHYILDENGMHGLKHLVQEIWGIPDYEEALIKQYLSSSNDRYSKIPFEALAKYGVIDVIMTLQLRKLFEQKLRENNQYEWPFMNLMMRGSNNLVDVEMRGTKVDVPYLQKVQAYLLKEMERIEAEAKATLSWDVSDLNLGSTQQCAVVVYDKLGFPLCRNRKLGPRSTAHGAIEPLQGKHPFIDKLLEYRRVSKMKSSYADNLLEVIDINSRVHASFLLHGTEVGRLSARNPALQTIPRPESNFEEDGIFGALIRAAFTASEGKMLGICDYSQAELRVAAVEADEPFLLEVYANNRDLHSEVAQAMYGSGYTKHQRVMCKMFNFSYLYGGSEYSFAKDAGLNINVAKKFVQDYNRVMPKLAAYRKTQFHKLAEQGYVQTRFGRRRRFPIITRVNEDDARKACVHSPIAGTASDLTLLSLCELNEQGYAVVLTVHDSILVEVDDAQEVSTPKGIRYTSETTIYASEVMKKTGEKYLPEVAWKSDPEVRPRWAEIPTQFLQTL